MSGEPTFADWLAICNLKAVYCRLLDAKDWEGWTQLFTEDFVQDVTGSGGGVFAGRDLAVAATRAGVEKARTVHQVHSPEIVIDGDEARAVWAMYDRVIWSQDRALTGYGHYHERYVRRDGRWLIAEQKLTRLALEFD